MIGLLWMIILGGFIFTKELVIRTGDEVLLKTVPVDPRDLFRGDYVTLRYDISRIDKNFLRQPIEEFDYGDTVYVVIETDSRGVAHIVSVGKNQPFKSSLFLRGEVIDVRRNEIDVEYGIESYFVPEGEGDKIERSIQDIYVKIVVDRHGRAIIKSLIADGEEIKSKST